MALGIVVRLATRTRMAAVESDGVTPERLAAAEREPTPAAT
jgi:hypothetical protein